MEYREPVSNPVTQAAQDAGFLAGIPWWAYLIVILIGVGLTILFTMSWIGQRRRAASLPPHLGMPSRSGGTGFLIGAIATAVLLILTPLTIMLIAQPWSHPGSQSSDSYADTQSGTGAPLSPSPDPATPSAPPSPSTPAPRTYTMPSNARWFFGTWGPNCPSSTADSITLSSDGTFQTSGGLGRWTIDSGSTITMTGNGRTITSRWVFSSYDAATAYGMGATGQPIRRCS